MFASPSVRCSRASFDASPAAFIAHAILAGHARCAVLAIPCDIADLAARSARGVHMIHSAPPAVCSMLASPEQRCARPMPSLPCPSGLRMPWRCKCISSLLACIPCCHTRRCGQWRRLAKGGRSPMPLPTPSPTLTPNSSPPSARPVPSRMLALATSSPWRLGAHFVQSCNEPHHQRRVCMRLPPASAVETCNTPRKNMCRHAPKWPPTPKRRRLDVREQRPPSPVAQERRARQLTRRNGGGVLEFQTCNGEKLARVSKTQKCREDGFGAG